MINNIEKLDDVPQIDIGNLSINGYVHASDVLPLPSSSPFGNLSLKYMKIIGQFSYINEKLRSIFSMHFNFKTNPFTPIPYSYLFGLDEIVFLLRRVTDELVSLLWLLDDWDKNNRCNTKIVIDCIGGVLNSKNQIFKQNYFGSHLLFMQNLNNISNAQKHSFINSDLNLIGDDEPVVNALRLDRNDLDNIDAKDYEKNLCSIYLRDLIDDFNKFFSDTKNFLITINDKLNKQV